MSERDFVCVCVCVSVCLCDNECDNVGECERES